MIRKVFPIITYNPWNPLVVKKVDPYAEFVILSALPHNFLT